MYALQEYFKAYLNELTNTRGEEALLGTVAKNCWLIADNSEHLHFGNA